MRRRSIFVLSTAVTAMSVILCPGTLRLAGGSEPPADITNILAQAPRLDPDDLPDIRVLLLADTKDHGPAGNGLHDYPLWQRRWALLLGGREASEAGQVNLTGPPTRDAELEQGAPGVQVSTAWNWPSDRQFELSDVIVAYCYIPWTEERIAQMRDYITRGGGLVLVHSATWTRPGPSAEVAEVVGAGGFQSYRHGPVPLTIATPDHPICLGLPPKLTLHDDETYWPPTPLMDRVVVIAHSLEKDEAVTESFRKPQPMLWCYSPGQGRVFGCVPGHCCATFDEPLFRLLLLRGIAWSAGGSPYRLDALALGGCAAADARP